MQSCEFQGYVKKTKQHTPATFTVLSNVSYHLQYHKNATKYLIAGI